MPGESNLWDIFSNSSLKSAKKGSGSVEISWEMCYFEKDKEPYADIAHYSN